MVTHSNLSNVKSNTWGYMAYNIGVCIYSISNNFNNVEYRDTLYEVFGQRLEGYVLYQDNCRLHLGESVRSYFGQDNVHVFNTPPQSPDLNPIENIWYLIDRKLDFYLRSNFINTPEELFNIVKQFAAEIPIETVNKLIDSVQKRIQECYSKGGKQTKY